LRRTILAPIIALPLLIITFVALTPAAPDPHVPFNPQNWGGYTAAVYGTSEAAPYASAELFAGPNKFGTSYFHGVLPNGRIVRPAGISTQVGMNPLGAVLTPDGKYLVTSNDDERDGGLPSLINPTNIGGYSLSVIDTAIMQVVSQVNSDKVFVGLQATGTGPYTVWASGGPSNSVKIFSVSTAGFISGPTGNIVIPPILPKNAGFVSNYTPDSSFNTKDSNGNLPPVPTNFDRKNGAQTTFPAGSALSSDGHLLYVACNGDNSLAVIDTTTMAVVKRVPAGFFPYGVAVSAGGSQVAVSNWGITEYKFKSPTYDPATGVLLSIAPAAPNQPDGFYVPPTSTAGANPQTSSVSLFGGADLASQGAIYLGRTLDALEQVGDTHPSATAIVRNGDTEVLYVTKSNDDSLGLVKLGSNEHLPDLDLSILRFPAGAGQAGRRLIGAYPNAIAVSPDNRRVYVAEAGINAVAELDTSDPAHPHLHRWIPTGWYPTGVVVSPDGQTLYITNAKGIGEDLNPNTMPLPGQNPSGVESFQDSNFIFGTVQKVDLNVQSNPDAAIAYNVTYHSNVDTSIVPLGGGPSHRIKHVFFILHENKTFDSMLGNHSDHFGPFASTNFNAANGAPVTDTQYTGVSRNTQMLALNFAAAVDYFSDSEESDAGHQFSASGTATDYTEKTLLVKSGRGLLVNKNFEPEDYPAGGYIFNNAARKGISFKDYGALIRITGTDTGTSTPTSLNDPPSGLAGYPQLQPDNRTITDPLVNLGDVDSQTQGLGQSYFMAMPVVAVLGGNNASGESRLDRNYPGYNFNISDQRRAIEFCKDFDRMVQGDTLPQFVYVYQPNDHTGGLQAPNKNDVGGSATQQVADGDVALGMVVQHIMQSKAYYDPATGDGSAIFITYDDAQSTLDHIHPHRTPLVVVSPYSKPGFVATRHYNTASVVKTEELLLGLPPNNLGDLFATDLRDLFQPTYNGITAGSLSFNRSCPAMASTEGRRIWALVKYLDTSAPDRDSRRLGVLARLSARADAVRTAARKAHRLRRKEYRAEQERLYRLALRLVKAPAPRDADD
jgi:YVTN family beta-propeller protein